MKQLLIHRIIIFALAVAIIVLWFRLTDKSAKDKSIGSLEERRDDLAKPGYPIKFDAEMNEYHLVYSVTNADGVRADTKVMMRFDPFSGARLPESKRDSFFVEPDTKEAARIRSRLSGAATVAGVRSILGEPDSAIGPFDGNKQQLTYNRIAKTIDIVVLESTNGQMSIMYMPKAKGTK